MLRFRRGLVQTLSRFLVVGRSDKSEQRGTAPDVLYFPALREKDPDELIMLCTIPPHDADDKYRVVRNDGRYVEMGHRELTNALNKTYWYLGAKLRRKESQDGF